MSQPDPDAALTDAAPTDAALTDTCRLLAEALKQRQVPREDRKAARALLKQVFLLTEADTLDEAVQAQLLAQVSALLPVEAEPEPEPWEPLALRCERMWPIRIKGALRREFADRLDERYTARAKRLQEIVDWFWDRCEPDGKEQRDKTVADRAMEEFGDTEMEYVWGRVRRKSP